MARHYPNVVADSMAKLLCRGDGGELLFWTAPPVSSNRIALIGQHFIRTCCSAEAVGRVLTKDYA